jgi:ankyrin repeat protein
MVVRMSHTSSGRVDHDREMLLCIEQGNATGVARLLAVGVDPNGDYSSGYVKVTPNHAIPTTGWSALHHAAYYGHTEIGRMLLEAGANVEAVGRYPGTPITQTARMGHAGFIRLLLEHGADPAQGMASATPHLACVRVLVEAGGDPGWCVRTAVVENHVEVLAYCLDAGADPAGHFKYDSDDGRIVRTPRMEALYYNRRECYRLLHGRTPYVSLSDAVADGNREAAAAFLAAGSRVDEQDTYGRMPMYWALHAGQPEMVEWLLEHGASLSRIQIGSVDTADRAAIEGGSIAVLELLKRHGVDWKKPLKTAVTRYDPQVLDWVFTNLELSEDDRRSAVWHTVADDRVEVLADLAAHGVDVYRAYRSEAELDMLMLAARYRAERVVEFLLARGADPFATNDGRTVLDYALEGPDWENAYELDQEDLEEPIARRLLALGVTSRWIPKASGP